MNCPYCNREIYSLTGLMEALKFQRHLRRCRKHPLKIELDDGTRKVRVNPPVSFDEALRIRMESKQ